MRNVFRILGILFILYLLDEYTVMDGTIITLLFMLTLVYAGYLIVKAFSGKKYTASMPAADPVAVRPVADGPARKRKYTGLIVVLLLVLAIVFIKYLAIASVNGILFMNRLLDVPGISSPVAPWALTGFFIGLIYGSFVAWKKYKLHFALTLFPLAVFAVFILVLYLINDPLATRQPVSVRSEKAWRFVEVRSSGYLPPYRTNSYADSNLVDEDEKTTWIENAKNAGIGESIAFRFTEPRMDELKRVTCIGLHIVNGYAKTEKLWASHNRLREFRLIHNESTIGHFTAKDLFNESELIAIRPFPVRYNDSISIQINSVYYGHRNNKLTAISELVPVLEIRE